MARPLAGDLSLAWYRKSHIWKEIPPWKLTCPQKRYHFKRLCHLPSTIFSGDMLVFAGVHFPDHHHMDIILVSRWWFQIFCMFIPKFGEDEPILTSIFFKWAVQPPTIGIYVKFRFGVTHGMCVTLCTKWNHVSRTFPTTWLLTGWSGQFMEPGAVRIRWPMWCQSLSEGSKKTSPGWAIEDEINHKVNLNLPPEI